ESHCQELYPRLSSLGCEITSSECYENSPISVLESFALKRPVIGARIGGIPELVKDGETGYTFEPGNAEELSDRIEAILSDDSSSSEMGKNAQRFVKDELNPDKYYQKLMEIYKGVIQ
ncbi:MAG: glycosyltransferase, partial [Nitrospirae bacterium]|nr:glycosyltransferase [Nitrospirota bacterium]